MHFACIIYKVWNSSNSQLKRNLLYVLKFQSRKIVFFSDKSTIKSTIKIFLLKSCLKFHDYLHILLRLDILIIIIICIKLDLERFKIIQKFPIATEITFEDTAFVSVIVIDSNVFWISLKIYVYFFSIIYILLFSI